MSLHAQNIYDARSSARLSALGHHLAVSTGADAIWGNPAGLSGLAENCFQLGAANRYNLSGLNDVAVAGHISGRNNGWGIGLHQFGYESFKEQAVSATYGHQLSSWLAIGVRFRYANSRVILYERYTSWSTDLGIQSQLTPSLFIGFTAQYLGSTIQNEAEILIPQYNAGVRYRVSSALDFYSSFLKKKSQQANIIVGLEYRLLDKIILRSGIETFPSSYAFGFGYHFLENWTIDFATQIHQQLGLSPSITLVYRWKKNSHNSPYI